MSLMHSIVNAVLMKNRVFYDPADPKDYASAREAEIMASARLKLPRGVSLRREALGGVETEWVIGKGNPADRIVLYLHGGGFVTGSSLARRSFTFHVADKLGLNVVSLDYRLAPEHPFPAAPEDCLAAYRALLERFEAKKIVLLGESAGGNLVLSLLLQAKAEGLPLPAAVFALSPTVQYDRELPSYRDNLAKDSVVTNLLPEVRDVYLRSRKESALKNPIAAPLYGDYAGCPPVLLWVSDCEVLRDDSLLLFEKLKEQRVTTRLYERSGMMHAWIIIPLFRESKKDLKILGEELQRAMEGSISGADEPIRLE
ncbi:MAG: alpha/beta hydrolase [Clostridia bacterium]